MLNWKTKKSNCFDYYHFQSIQTSFGVKKTSYIPGEYLFFEGDISNENSYPIVDGYLLVRISRQNKNFATEGHYVYDEFIPLKDIVLDANQTKKVKFSWKIPQGIPSGEYRADFFFSVGKKFNLAGLPFSNEVTGGFMTFNIEQGSSITVIPLREQTKVNNEKYNHIGTWPNVVQNEKVEIIQPIKNNSGGIQKIKTTYNLYRWDAQSENNKIDSKEETISLDPGEIRNLTYTINQVKETVYLLRISTDSGRGEKSITDIRITSEGESPRINFPAITVFPLKKDQKNTLFTCLHNTSNIDTQGKLVLTLQDKNGNQVEEIVYQGIITGSMALQAKDFVPRQDYNQVTLKAELFDKNNLLVDSYQTIYDCQMINQAKCSNQLDAGFSGSEATSRQGIQSMTLFIIAILIILLIAIIVMVIKGKINGKKISVLFVLLIVGGGIFGGNDVNADEFICQDRDTIKEKLYLGKYPKNRMELTNSQSFSVTGDYIGQQDPDEIPDYLNEIVRFFTLGLLDAEDLSSNYNVFNGSMRMNFEAGIVDGKTITPVGSTIIFGEKGELTFNGVGGSWDTPYGYWVKNESDLNWVSDCNIDLETYEIYIRNMEPPLGDQGWLRFLSSYGGDGDLAERYGWTNITAVFPEVTYNSSNPDVIKCSDNICNAVGTGTAVVVADFSDSKAKWNNIYVREAGWQFFADDVNFYGEALSWEIIVPNNEYNLTAVAKSNLLGSGNITFTPEGTDCIDNTDGEFNKSCRFPENQEVIITAIPDAGSNVSYFSGNCIPVPGAANACSIIMNNEETVEVWFESSQPPTPPTIIGAGTLKNNEKGDYLVSNVSDPDGNQIKYEMCWDYSTVANACNVEIEDGFTFGPGDGTYTDNFSNSWSSPGQTTIAARAVDTTGLFSAWQTQSINIIECIPNFSYFCDKIEPICTENDCGETINGSTVCIKIDSANCYPSQPVSDNECEMNGVSCSVPTKYCDCSNKGIWEEVTP